MSFEIDSSQREKKTLFLNKKFLRLNQLRCKLFNTFFFYDILNYIF